MHRGFSPRHLSTHSAPTPNIQHQKSGIVQMMQLIMGLFNFSTHLFSIGHNLRAQMQLGRLAIWSLIENSMQSIVNDTYLLVAPQDPSCLCPVPCSVGELSHGWGGPRCCCLLLAVPRCLLHCFDSYPLLQGLFCQFASSCFAGL